MPKGYWIVQVDLKDHEEYKGYMAATAEPFGKFGARYLVRAGRFENPDGTSRARHALIEFPSMRRPLRAGGHRNTKRQERCVCPFPTWILSSLRATTALSPRNL